MEGIREDGKAPRVLVCRAGGGKPRRAVVWPLRRCGMSLPLPLSGELRAAREASCDASLLAVSVSSASPSPQPALAVGELAALPVLPEDVASLAAWTPGNDETLWR